MAKTQQRITIDCKGKTLRVASMRLTGDGSLILAVKSGDKTREMGKRRLDSGGADHNHDITEHRFTLHQSLDSPDISRVNYHVVLKERGHKKMDMQTTVLKKNDGFICLYSRRGCEDLATSKTNFGKAINISLGNFDDQLVTLHYSLFISSIKCKFSGGSGLTFNTQSWTIGTFRITVVWSFMPWPGAGSGLTITTHATWDEAGGPIIQCETLSESEALALYYDVYRFALYELLDITLKYLVFKNEDDKELFRSYFLDHSPPLKNGDPNHQDYKNYLETRPVLPRLLEIGYYDPW